MLKIITGRLLPALKMGSGGVFNGAEDTAVGDYRFQISRAYSRIVRSLENFPMRATFKMAFFAQEVKFL